MTPREAEQQRVDILNEAELFEKGDWMLDIRPRPKITRWLRSYAALPGSPETPKEQA